MDEHQITGFKLRPAAKRDLEHIWRYTCERWSEKQAVIYFVQLDEAFAWLVANPFILRERQELAPPTRVKSVGPHLIFYKITEDYVDIIRVRHEREDWNDPA